MFSFAVQIALMASLAVIVYMLAKALPRVAQESLDAEESGSFDKFASRVPLEKLDVAIQRFFIKILRKMRVLVLKFDNLLNEYISSLRKNSIVQNGQESIKERMDMLVSSNGNEKEINILESEDEPEEVIESEAQTDEEAEEDIEEEKI